MQGANVLLAIKRLLSTARRTVFYSKKNGFLQREERFFCSEKNNYLQHVIEADIEGAATAKQWVNQLAQLCIATLIVDLYSSTVIELVHFVIHVCISFSWSYCMHQTHTTYNTFSCATGRFCLVFWPLELAVTVVPEGKIESSDSGKFTVGDDCTVKEGRNTSTRKVAAVGKYCSC